MGESGARDAAGVSPTGGSLVQVSDFRIGYRDRTCSGSAMLSKVAELNHCYRVLAADRWETGVGQIGDHSPKHKI
jgi:hypothetical protein